MKVTLANDSGEHDVTEAVKTMFDLVTSSMDWGSGFLDFDDQYTVVEFGLIAGFDVTAHLRNLQGVLDRREKTVQSGDPWGSYGDPALNPGITVEEIHTLRQRIAAMADDVTDFDECEGGVPHEE